MAAQASSGWPAASYQTAARAGYYDISLPLLEAIQLIGPESSETAATIGIQRMLLGRRGAGREELRPCSRRVGPKSAVAGRRPWDRSASRCFEGGRDAAALKEVQTAWSIDRGRRSEERDLELPADMRRLLRRRRDAPRAVRGRAEAWIPALAPQAARDLAELLDSPLRYGVRRLPALAIMGKLELLQGNRDKALQLLREARRIPWQSLEDRMDGPVGRIAHPRYRRMALETLSRRSPTTRAAAERDEIGAELRELEPK